MDLLIALIPAIAWGSIGLVSGKLGGKAFQQTLGMTLGALVFGVITLVIFKPEITTKTMIVGILSGLFWSIGQSQQFQAMKDMGVSKTIPMSTGMQLVVNTLAGAILFHEWYNAKMTVIGVVALIVLITGATLTSMKDKSRSDANQEANELASGFRALIISTLGYGGYTIIVKSFGIGGTSVVFPQAIGMVIGALIFGYLSIGKEIIAKKTFYNILTGILWGLGNLFMFISTDKIGLAISFSLAQCGIVISTIGSIYLLNEYKTKREKGYIFIGCLLVIIGGIMLGNM